MGKPLQQDEQGNIMNDVETAKTQKGYANYEKNQQEAQRKLETKDADIKQSIKSGVEKVRGILGFKQGGVTRGDGIAKRGKTKGKTVMMCGGGKAKK
jgi:hypothetical protein